MWLLNDKPTKKKTKEELRKIVFESFHKQVERPLLSSPFPSKAFLNYHERQILNKE